MIADEPCESKHRAAIHSCLLIINHIKFTRTSFKLFSITLKFHELIHFNFDFESMIHILIFWLFYYYDSWTIFHLLQIIYVLTMQHCFTSSRQSLLQWTFIPTAPKNIRWEHDSNMFDFFLYLTNTKKESIYVFLRRNFIFKDAILIWRVKVSSVDYFNIKKRKKIKPNRISVITYWTLVSSRIS